MAFSIYQHPPARARGDLEHKPGLASADRQSTQNEIQEEVAWDLWERMTGTYAKFINTGLLMFAFAS